MDLAVMEIVQNTGFLYVVNCHIFLHIHIHNIKTWKMGGVNGSSCDAFLEESVVGEHF
jgi:hypothetical protein